MVYLTTAAGQIDAFQPLKETKMNIKQFGKSRKDLQILDHFNECVKQKSTPSLVQK
ncbi:hypothetical protein E4U36_002636 [Claviceps purpurea]|nr:hypothetical protein E4U36_002636 [Claviceps purpurea]